MSYEYKGIEQICNQQNTPGVFCIEYAPLSWIDSIPEVPNLNFEIPTPIVFQSGKSWLQVYAVQNSILFNETGSSNNQGSIFNATLSGRFIGWSKGLVKELNFMQHDCFLVKVKDKNGDVRIVGSKCNPLSFTSSGTTAQKGGFRGHQFSFRGELLHKSYCYNF